MSQIITVASGKGGVGKTWFAISLAGMLSTLGKKTLLFDGDLGLANVDIQLGLIPKTDLSHYLRREKKLNEIILHLPKLGIDVIPGGSGQRTLANIDRVTLKSLLQDLSALRKNYDYIIIDSAAGVQKSIISLSNLADHTVMVTTSEPTAMTDAYAFVKLKVRSVKKENQNIYLLTNMVETYQEGEKTYRKFHKVCHSFLKVSIMHLGSIRKDMRVKDSIQHQSSILYRYPNSNAVDDLQQIVTKITKQCYELAY